jgi:predicted DNA-binding WGR domain protein
MLPCPPDLNNETSWQCVRFEKDTRYYSIRLEQDLLEDWVVAITYGRINSRLGQSKLLAFDEFEQAYAHFKKMSQMRHKRQYLPVSGEKNFPTAIRAIKITQSNQPKVKNYTKSTISSCQNSFLNLLIE